MSSEVTVFTDSDWAGDEETVGLQSGNSVQTPAVLVVTDEEPGCKLLNVCTSVKPVQKEQSS